MQEDGHQRPAIRISIVSMLRRRAVPGACVLLAGVVLGFLASLQLSPAYTSTTSVIVTPTGLPAASTNNSLPHTEPPLNLETEAQVITSQQVATAAAKLVGDQRPLAEILQNVRVLVPPNTTVLQIAISDLDPAKAQALSAAFAKAYLTNRKSVAESQVEGDLEALRDQLSALNKQLSDVSEEIARSSDSSPERAYAEAQQRILIDQVSSASDNLNRLSATEISGGSLLAEAGEAVGPSLPLSLLAQVVGILFGLVGALLLMFWLERRDRTVRQPEDVDSIPGVTIVGAGARRRGSAGDGRRAAIDVWAALRNDVEIALPSGRTTLLAVPIGDEAALAHAVVSLATAFARTGVRVGVICADFESDLLAEALGVPPKAVGLVEMLNGTDLAGVHASSTVDGVFVIPGGGGGRGTGDLLHGRKFAEFSTDLKKAFDLTIIQALPLNAVAVARVSDQPLILLETERSRYDDVETLVSQLQRSGSRTVSVAVLDRKWLEADLGSARAISWGDERRDQPSVDLLPPDRSARNGAVAGAADRGGDASGAGPGPAGRAQQANTRPQRTVDDGQPAGRVVNGSSAGREDGEAEVGSDRGGDGRAASVPGARRTVFDVSAIQQAPPTSPRGNRTIGALGDDGRSRRPAAGGRDDATSGNGLRHAEASSGRTSHGPT